MSNKPKTFTLEMVFDSEDSAESFVSGWLDNSGNIDWRRQIMQKLLLEIKRKKYR